MEVARDIPRIVFVAPEYLQSEPLQITRRIDQLWSSCVRNAKVLTLQNGAVRYPGVFGLSRTNTVVSKLLCAQSLALFQPELVFLCNIEDDAFEEVVKPLRAKKILISFEDDAQRHAERRAGVDEIWVDSAAEAERIKALSGGGAVEVIEALTPCRSEHREDLDRVVRRALGRRYPAPRMEQFKATRRALRFRWRLQHGVFNPFTRYLEIGIEVSGGGALVRELWGEIVCANGAVLSNAWVQHAPGAPAGKVLLKSSAVLPEHTGPDDLLIDIGLQENILFTVASRGRVREQRAGLVSITPRDDGQATLDLWSADPEAAAEFGGRRFWGKATGARPASPYLIKIDASLSAGGDAVRAAPRRGVGQRFRQPAEILGLQRPSCERFAKMRRAFAGRHAWLVGNGPSVAIGDLDRLTEKTTFCFNRFHLAYRDTSLRPTFTVTADQQMIEDFGPEIARHSAGELFVGSDHPVEGLGDHVWVRLARGFPPLFSKDASRCVWPGGSSVFVAMQIGYFLGIRKFFLYGADFRFIFQRNSTSRSTTRAAVGDGNHFINGYRNELPWCPPSLQNITAAFLSARVLLESEGGFVKNATRGGELEIFDRISFEEALSWE